MDNFLVLMWDIRYILIILAGVAFFAFFEWEKTKEITNQLMLVAKSLAKDAVLSSGQEQEDWVVQRGYALLPLPVRLVITEEVFRKIVRFLYHKAMDLVDDGKINGSIDRG